LRGGGGAAQQKSRRPLSPRGAPQKRTKRVVFRRKIKRVSHSGGRKKKCQGQLIGLKLPIKRPNALSGDKKMDPDENRHERRQRKTVWDKKPAEMDEGL